MKVGWGEDQVLLGNVMVVRHTYMHIKDAKPMQVFLTGAENNFCVHALTYAYISVSSQK